MQNIQDKCVNASASQNTSETQDNDSFQFLHALYRINFPVICQSAFFLSFFSFSPWLEINMHSKEIKSLFPKCISVNLKTKLRAIREQECGQNLSSITYKPNFAVWTVNSIMKDATHIHHLYVKIGSSIEFWNVLIVMSRRVSASYMILCLHVKFFHLGFICFRDLL